MAYRSIIQIQPIVSKLQLMQNKMQLFKIALSELEKFTFFAEINEDDHTQFNDHSQLLDHLRQQVLPICNSSTDYKFHINFISDKNAAETVTAQILQMHPINLDRCSSVSFSYGDDLLLQLPVVEISAWLSRDLDGKNPQKEKRTLFFDKFLKVQSAVEICSHFKEVDFFNIP